MPRVSLLLISTALASATSCGGGGDDGVTLTAIVSGTGDGRITSSPAGIDCGSDCSEAFPPGTVVTLTATAAPGTTFDGWSGACSGTSTCVITTDTPVGVNATFTLEEFSLTITPAGTGSGVVTSDPAGIDCGADCAETYGYGTMVALTATPTLESSFTSWDGGGCSGTGPCTTTITQATAITSTFTLNQYALTVTTDGTGAGTVTSDVPGIDCGVDCSELYDHDTVVTLTAVPNAGSAFTGWSGGCSGIAPCTVTLVAAVDVNATFTLSPYGGVIALLEDAVLNPGTSGTFFGQGVRASITFDDLTALPGPVMEEMSGSLFGCKVWSYTGAQAAQAAVGIDEGPVQINSPSGSGTALLPSCTFATGLGYLCPHTGTQSTGGTIAMGPAAGTATLTDADVTFNAGNTANRYVRITGATAAGNNGAFPIVALGGANTIVYGNPAFVAETLPATAVHVNLAGVGPTPQAPDPGFLADTATLDFVHAVGGGGHIPGFTAATGSGQSVGDDFTLALTELNRLNAIPRTGAAFTVSCAAADCPAGSASGTILDLVTTDAPTAGLSPFAMPAPITLSVRVRCAVLGATAITVPAGYSAFIMTSGATRIRASFIRPTLMTGGPSEVTSFTGHSVTGFTN